MIIFRVKTNLRCNMFNIYFWIGLYLFSLVEHNDLESIQIISSKYYKHLIKKNTDTTNNFKIVIINFNNLKS